MVSHAPDLPDLPIVPKGLEKKLDLKSVSGRMEAARFLRGGHSTRRTVW